MLPPFYHQLLRKKLCSRQGFLPETEDKEGILYMIKNKMLKTKEAFGGFRLIGYLNSEPLLAQFRLDKNGFTMKFNHEIMDEEFAGKFSSNFIESNLEIIETPRLSAPLDTIPKRIMGGRTTLGTIAWIATLMEIEAMKSDLAYKNGKLSKGFLHHVAHAIFVDDVLYVDDLPEATSFLDAGKYFKLEKNDIKNTIYLDSMIQSTLYPQFLSHVKSKKDVTFTNKIRIDKLAA